MKKLLPTAILLAACARPPAPARDAAATRPDSVGPVRPGIETFLADLPPAVRGKRVGLITNHTGIDRARTPDIDLIARHPRAAAGGPARAGARHPRQRGGG